MVNIDILEGLDIFNELTIDEIKKIQPHCTRETYQLDQMLFEEGEPAEEMWIVSEGEVALRFKMPGNRPLKEESTLSTHHKDIPESQVFGWSCFIKPYRMRLSAFCASRRCTAIKINRTALNEIMESDTDIGYKIMKYLVQVVGYRFNQFRDEVAKFMGLGIMNSW